MHRGNSLTTDGAHPDAIGERREECQVGHQAPPEIQEHGSLLQVDIGQHATLVPIDLINDAKVVALITVVPSNKVVALLFIVVIRCERFVDLDLGQSVGAYILLLELMGLILPRLNVDILFMDMCDNFVCFGPCINIACGG